MIYSWPRILPIRIQIFVEIIDATALFPIIEQKSALRLMESTFVFYLADTLSGVVQFDLLGLDEHAQFLVGEHGNRSQDCAFDEIEWQNAK